MFSARFCTFCESGCNWSGVLGLGDTRTRGNGSHEMGDYLRSVQLGDDCTPIHVTAGRYFNCVLCSIKAIKCWGKLSASSTRLARY